jgi:D-glycero-D-manno-heptose 1,7-bisphosphate phosphatase
MPGISAPSHANLFTDSRLGEDLLWRDVRIARLPQPVPALFLDRDGVIVEETLYLRDPRDVRLLPGVAELMRIARRFEMPVVQVTNQAGIAHGYFDWSDFVKVESEVTQQLGREGAAVDAVFACPFHPQGLPPYQHGDHPWRKPNPGMLIEAACLMHIDISRSIMIGDNAQDLEAARSAGCAFGIHILTGHGRTYEPRSRTLATEDFAVRVATDAIEAATFLANQVR